MEGKDLFKGIFLVDEYKLASKSTRVIPLSTIQRILELYKSVRNYSEVAEAMGINRSTVRKYAKLYGFA